ncbi:MAG: hypothetical protein ACI915_004958 [Gammaproteobacteria bacterium]|jgi:hypothetical protein
MPQIVDTLSTLTGFDIIKFDEQLKMKYNDELAQERG